MRAYVFVIPFLLLLVVQGCQAQWFEEPITLATKDQVRTVQERRELDRALKAGNKAYSKGDYTEAIREYDKALLSAPGHAQRGVFYINKSLAYLNRGKLQWGRAQVLLDPEKSEMLNAAKLDLQIAALESTRAVTVERDELGPASGNLLQALAVRAQTTYVLVTTLGRQELRAAIDAFDSYQAIETRKDRWLGAQRKRAEMYFLLGDLKMSVIEYERVLSDSPQDLDAILHLGASLATFEDRTSLQRAKGYLTKYLELAPAADPARRNASNVLNYLQLNDPH